MNVPNELKMKVRRKTVPADRERLPFGWTPSPAYPGRLGVAGSVLMTSMKMKPIHWQSSIFIIHTISNGKLVRDPIATKSANLARGPLPTQKWLSPFPCPCLPVPKPRAQASLIPPPYSFSLLPAPVLQHELISYRSRL